MAKGNSKSETPARTEPVDVAPPESNGLLAAWDGLYHALGARFESHDIVDDGVILRGVTFDGGINSADVIRDVNRRNRRVPLFPTLNILNGMEPMAPATSQDWTVWSVQFFRGSVEDGATRVPKYVRDGIANYKERTGTKVRRGPKPKTISLKDLSNLNADTLTNANVNADDLAHLIAVATAAQSAMAAANPTPATESES